MNTNVFAPNPFKKNIFTLLAKDNIDFNATSPTAVQHFHETSMTAMQFFSEKNLGDEILCNTDIKFTSNMTDITSKKVLQILESYTNVDQLNVRKTPLYAPYIKTDTTRYHDNGNYIKSEKYREIEWLQTVCTSDCFVLWAKYHSDRNLEVMPLPGLKIVLPIIPKTVHTLATQYHCMKIVK